MKLTRIVIVTQFHQIDYFQWHDALLLNQKKLNVSVHPLVVTNLHTKIGVSDAYWNQLREADAVLVYVTRVNPDLDWWELPKFIKKFMKPEAKMLVCVDDEYQWLWNPEYTFWGTGMKNPDFQSPEEFFRRTGILEVPDTHLVVTKNPLFAKYTTKPVIQLPLPQLVRYDVDKYKFRDDRTKIAIMRHYATGCSFSHTLENVIKPNNLPVHIFNWYGGKAARDYVSTFNLPAGSMSFSKLPLKGYEDELYRYCSIGIDDPTGYIGWSRFVMECAIAYIPCVGSTDAVEMLFPELYTKPQDYAKQIELIERLRTDKEFYKRMAETGHKKCFEQIGTDVLCEKLMKIFHDMNISSSWTLEDLFVDFLQQTFPRFIPPRPSSDTGCVSDSISKRILTQAQWDMLYGKWKEILDNQELYDKCKKRVMDRNV